MPASKLNNMLEIISTPNVEADKMLYDEGEESPQEESEDEPMEESDSE